MNNYQLNPKSFTSQKAAIREHLLNGETINIFDAFRICKTVRLSDIIFRLRKEGLPIITEIIETETNKRVGLYHIDKQYFINNSNK